MDELLKQADIVVTNPDGQTTTLSGAFDFIPIPPPIPRAGGAITGNPIAAPSPRPGGVGINSQPSPVPGSR